MDDGARRWLLKAARKNFWRVSRWYELDDLIQEGYEVYYETLVRYPGATDPPHRMAMFKLLFMSRLNDLSNKRTRSMVEVLAGDVHVSRDGEPEALESLLASVAAEPDIAEALASVASAPQCVRDALALMSSGDRRLRYKYKRERKGRPIRRETLNERLCRLLGYDAHTTDIVGGIKACLAREG